MRDVFILYPRKSEARAFLAPLMALLFSSPFQGLVTPQLMQSCCCFLGHHICFKKKRKAVTSHTSLLSDKAKLFQKMPGNFHSHVMAKNVLQGYLFQQGSLENYAFHFLKHQSTVGGVDCNIREQESEMSVRLAHRHYLPHATAKLISIVQLRKLRQLSNCLKTAKHWVLYS